jgi:hypothetical protein
MREDREVVIKARHYRRLCDIFHTHFIDRQFRLSVFDSKIELALLDCRCRAEVCVVVDFKGVREKRVLTCYLVLMYFLRSYCLGVLLHASDGCRLLVGFDYRA